MPRRSDTNQAAIVAELRALGYRVADTHALGQGAPDILVGATCNSQPALLWVEIKTQRGKLTPDECRFHEEWKGLPVIVARSAEDVLRWFGWNGAGAGTR